MDLQVRGETRATLEAADGNVVVVNKLQLDGTQQLLHFMVTQTVSAAHAAYNLLKQREVFSQKATGVVLEGRGCAHYAKRRAATQASDSRIRRD